MESFPKNQRFIFGQRIAGRTLNILEVLVETMNSPRKDDLLARANREIEVVRWLIRTATNRQPDPLPPVINTQESCHVIEPSRLNCTDLRSALPTPPPDP